jgi:hypothetical protein
VLVSTGHISNHTLNIALSAHSLVSSKSITLEICVKAMKEADKRGESLEQVLLAYGLSAELLDYTNKLGQLLVDSEFVTERQRVEALKMALSSSLPMGRIFVLQRIITNIQAYAALSAQILIRRGEVTREQAITALKLTKFLNCPLEIALRQGGFTDSQNFGKVMLGELLMISNQISEGRFVESLEKSLIERVPLGQVLVEFGCISPERLERALYAQQQIGMGQMTQTFAADFVKFDQGDAMHALQEFQKLVGANTRRGKQQDSGTITLQNLTPQQQQQQQPKEQYENAFAISSSSGAYCVQVV